MKLPKPATFLSKESERKKRIDNRRVAREAHTRMYNKLLQGRRQRGVTHRPPSRPPEVVYHVESYELTYTELRVMLRGGRK